MSHNIVRINKIVKVNNIKERNLLTQVLIELDYKWNVSGETLSERPISSVTNTLPIVIFIYDDGAITYSSNCDNYTWIDFKVYYDGFIIKDKLKEFLE